jgi:hypothetical protein
VTVGNGRDLRQVRDRDHLCPFREAPQRLSDRVCRLAADARVDLVEDHRLPTADGCDGERDSRQLATRGRLGDRRKREARVRADQERDLVGPGRTRIALAELGLELAVAEADAVEFGLDRGRERLRS